MKLVESSMFCWDEAFWAVPFLGAPKAPTIDLEIRIGRRQMLGQMIWGGTTGTQMSVGAEWWGANGMPIQGKIGEVYPLQQQKCE